MRKLLISPILLSAFILCSCTTTTPKRKKTSDTDTTITTSSSQQDPTVKEVLLDKNEANAKPGSSFTLAAQVVGDNDPSQEVVWTSSDESIATVSNGVVAISENAKDGDSVTITATSSIDENKSASCVVTVEKDAPSGTKYTVLMYVCGSDLESGSGAASKDINEVKSSSKASENINFVIETGGASSWKTSTFDANYLQRWHIDNKKLVKDSDETKANMGSSATLQSFLLWGKSAYPADKYALILWNHGGAASGVCSDEIFDDSLTASEVSSAIKAANIDLEWIGYDACIMDYIDNMSLNADYAKYMVASQEFEWGDGWDYTGWVPSLYENPDISTPTLLAKICDSFVDFYDSEDYQSYDNDQTLAAIDLVKAKTFINEFNTYSGQLSTTNYNSMKTAYNDSSVLKFGNVSDYGTQYAYGLADFKSFMNKVKSSVSIDTTALMSAYDDMIVHVKYGSAYKSSKVPTGCNVFIAADNPSAIAISDYTENDTKFSAWRTLQINNGNWASGWWY